MRLVAAALFLAACSPIYQFVKHSPTSPEGRMCEMQAQKARDYCRKACGYDDDDCRGGCLAEYDEAWTTCGGEIERVCVANCN